MLVLSEFDVSERGPKVLGKAQRFRNSTTSFGPLQHGPAPFGPTPGGQIAALSSALLLFLEIARSIPAKQCPAVDGAAAYIKMRQTEQESVAL